MAQPSLNANNLPETLNLLDADRTGIASKEVSTLNENEQSIVNRLPPEVLSQIFYALRPRSDSYPPYPLPNGFSRWIARAALVCRYWREVVFTLSCLHERIRFIHLDDPTFRRALYSRQTPLSIFYSSPSRSTSAETGSRLSTPVLRAINAQARRLQELHLSLNAHVDERPLESLTIINTPAPNLEALSLIVRSGNWRPLGNMPSLFNNITPALRRLTLCRVSYRPITQLRGLTHLYIFHDIMDDFFAQLCHGLAGCPDLEELVVVKCGFHPRHAPDVEAIDVQLPRLRKISMGILIDSRTAVSLFSHLIISETSARSVWGSDERHRDDLSFIFNINPKGIKTPEVHTLVIIPRGLVLDGAYFKNGTFYIAGVPSQIRLTILRDDSARAFARVKRLVIVSEPDNKSVHSSSTEWTDLLHSIFKHARYIENITFASYDPWQFWILISIPLQLSRTEFADSHGGHLSPITLPYLRSLTLETEGFTCGKNDVEIKDRDQGGCIDIRELISLARYRKKRGRMISQVEFTVNAAAKAQLGRAAGKVLDIKEKWENRLDFGNMVTWLRSMVHERPNSIGSEDDSQ